MSYTAVQLFALLLCLLHGGIFLVGRVLRPVPAHWRVGGAQRMPGAPNVRDGGPRQSD